MSLSARRAWIEIAFQAAQLVKTNTVALRKESVDRNLNMLFAILGIGFVALRKESVDRNNYFYIIKITRISRSPQGERG